MVTKDTKATKNKNHENNPHLEIPEVVLVDFNIANNEYEHDLKVLCRFVPYKSFGQSLDISPKIKKIPWSQSFHIIKFSLQITFSAPRDKS